MSSLTETCHELLDIINDLEKTITKQNEVINRLVNENAELSNALDEFVKLPY